MSALGIITSINVSNIFAIFLDVSELASVLDSVDSQFTIAILVYNIVRI
ncbi:MAG: hypothetical protein V7K69_13595 [Nostoc sp.]|jgi:hypothetical protein|nr:hypothetical protein [Nostoc sp. ATCC 53789]MBD2507904.1 hypothetical protein [Desmonostoc muscorum FACHB-395]QHG16369.1 hypothetical protein GJB62_10555 [Nostoc sp. ATCC 53789]